MKKIIAILMTLTMIFGLSACSGNKADVVGTWKLERHDITEYAVYYFVYEDGYYKRLDHNHRGPYSDEYEWYGAVDWEYDGNTFIEKSCATGKIISKLTVEDGKMYTRDHSLFATKISNDTSDEKPCYEEDE